jgi:hypothetical protein
LEKSAPRGQQILKASVDSSLLREKTTNKLDKASAFVDTVKA